MMNWVLNDLLQENVPKLIGGLLALAAAHSSLLAKWGISVDWTTFGGKLTTAAILLVGMLAGHHTANAVMPSIPAAPK